MFGDYGYDRIVGFEPQWVRKGIKCPKPEHVSKKLKEICSFFSEAGQDTVSLVMPKIKESKSNNKPDYSKMYFTLEAVDDCNFVFFGQDAFVDFAYIQGRGQITKEQARQMIQGGGEGVKYSLDGGKTWNEPEEQVIHIGEIGGFSVDLSASTIPQVLAGQNVMLKGVNDGMSCDEFGFVASCGIIKSDGKYKASGNILSIAYGDDFIGQTSMSGKGFQYLFSYGFVTGYDDFNLIDVGNLILPATTLSRGCYASMFRRCASLTTAPELPATTLSEGCYYSMFSKCTSLTAAPELPATTLASACYRDMFYGCASLTTVPGLPATTLAIRCYDSMFDECSSLTTAPELPATTLADNCYGHMFNGCTSLTTAPELPATTLAYNCYEYMFNGCTSLTTAPELPATTLADNCYGYMFEGCTSLTATPELSATTLASACYSGMFSGCTSLTAAPELPATTLAEYCYRDMFYGCASLTQAPTTLPATTLAYECYYEMFTGCASLTTAPELPATTLADNCYVSMFHYCTSLNYIKCLATDISAYNCTYHWVYGVSDSGTFVKAIEDWPTGNDGIPSGWTVEDDR